MRFFRALGHAALLLASTGGFGGVYAKSEPDVHITTIDRQPRQLMFFEDSETVMYIAVREQTVMRSTDAGEKWEAVDGPKKGEAFDVYLHPRDNQVAVIVGSKHTHWVTYDQGKTWSDFFMEEPPSLGEPIKFHYDDSKKIMFNTFDDCIFSNCIGQTYYTTDGFKTKPQLMHARRKDCVWAKTNKLFTTGDEKKDAVRALCVVEGRYSASTKDWKLMISDDYFETGKEPVMSSGRTVPGMQTLAPTRGFMIAAAQAQGSHEMAMYISADTETWHRAEFGGDKILEDSYTILESTNHSIQLDVTPDDDVPIGTLFTSNSNGTYFTEVVKHVNRDPNRGMVDFETIQNIQGVFIANEVVNHEEVLKHPEGRRKLKSKISFDDGHTLHPLKAGKDDLHLHSVTELSNSGRIFSSPAPGILMGNGNSGEYLEGIDKASMWISDDGGLNWRNSGLDGAQKYEFGDSGSILAAVANSGETDTVSYSLNHGKSWKKFNFGKKIKPWEITTVSDSTSLKFVITGAAGGKWHIVALDFADLHERTCKEDDFEDWWARKNDKGEPQCVMGQKQHFRRRKPDTECFIDKEFIEPLPQNEACECTDDDFECDFNFKRSDDRKECLPVRLVDDPEDKCKTAEGTFTAPSGWRKIPGNQCKRTSGKQKDDKVERPCKDAFREPNSGDVKAKFNKFSGGQFRSMYYMERDPQAKGDDETVLVLTDKREVWKSHDHGQTWEKALPEDEEVYSIYTHPYNNDYVYFITLSRTVYYSKDRAKHIHRFEAPDVPNMKGLPFLSFHRKYPDWLIWTGSQDCKFHDRANCHVTAHISKKNGAEGSWKVLLPWVKRCEFMYREGRPNSENLIYCEHWEKEDVEGPLQLLSSDDLFEGKRESKFKNMVAFATMQEFVVVAAKTDDGRWLSAYASVDGQTYAHAAFPANFQVDHQAAYTVLDSETNSVFLHVTTNNDKNHEFGSILKSNSNGTSYVLSVDQVNRNTDGFVDWEKMEGLEGVAVINVVANKDDMKRGGDKKLKSMITHDDGAAWSYIPCPEKDLDGKSYNCDSNDLTKRSLHLHGYTERKDPRETYSSPSAVGLMIGIGNVGEHLGLYNEGDTFLTKDGGITWKAVQKGTYMWEYGDQGSVIVLVKRGVATREVLYTTDEGETWKKFRFDDDSETIVESITTVPSDNSRKFLLWGKKDGALTTVSLDFSGLTDKQCKLDKEDIGASDSDYNLWSPTHPGKDEPECLFGHVSRYYRKKADSNCYNGPLIDRLHDIARNCSCTRQDFECDFNYERNPHTNTCEKIQGLEERPWDAVCKEKPDLDSYYEPTGYRKIPLTTCSGGRELEYVGEPFPCPGHEEEFEKKHRVSGFTVFLSIVIPVAAAAGVGYYVWNHWDGKFGRIRLGEPGSTSAGFGEFFGSDKPWIKWPVAAVSGLVAVVVALPLLVSSLWRSVAERMGMGGGYGGIGSRTYTSRSSFARGRGDYAEVDNDEGELLGDESDEEV